MSNRNCEIVDIINATLDRLDPDRQTIAVGTAAVQAYVKAAGATPINVGDVDVLCSDNFFKATLESATKQVQSFEGPVSCRVRRPYGRLLNAGATNLALDIYFDYSEGLLPFTACTSMSTAGYPIDYASRNNDSKTEFISGYRCLRLNESLLMAATVGRPKDILVISNILAEKDLFGDHLLDDQVAAIEERAIESRQLVLANPNIAYPRTL